MNVYNMNCHIRNKTNGNVYSTYVSKKTAEGRSDEQYTVLSMQKWHKCYFLNERAVVI